jgi:predicted alpha/beta-hydrolase family hydrolase
LAKRGRIAEPDAPAFEPELIRFQVPDSDDVSGLLVTPEKPTAGYVLAHSAGAGMAHSFMNQAADGLARRGIATLRYQFPYMEAKRGRPDSPAVATAAVRAAVGEARRRLPKLPLVAGGKSFGGRMTSQAEAAEPLGVVGLGFLCFPLHPPEKPGTSRADHLADVKVPMLFLQGTKDEFASLDLLEPTVAGLGPRARLHLVPEANHSFHVPARSGRKDSDVREELFDTLAAWIAEII